MKRFINFVIRIVRGFLKHDMFVFAGEMTYKLILSLFPLLIFAFSFIGFLRIDTLDINVFLDTVQGALPPQVMDIIDNFIKEVIDTRSTTVLSASLALAIYNASSGFAAVIKGINKSYGEKDTRGWLRRRALSILLVLLFVAIVVLAMGFMVFSNNIERFIYGYLEKTAFTTMLFGIVGYFSSIFIILCVIVMIFKIGSCKKVKILDVLPGACVTVIFWVLFSQLFSIYVSNYARYTVIYGSIGSIFILLYWLYFVIAFLLVGSEVNALLSAGYADSKPKRVL